MNHLAEITKNNYVGILYNYHRDDIKPLIVTKGKSGFNYYELSVLDNPKLNPPEDFFSLTTQKGYNFMKRVKLFFENKLNLTNLEMELFKDNVPIFNLSDGPDNYLDAVDGLFG